MFVLTIRELRDSSLRENSSARGISLKKEGLIREFYTFVDASKIIACVDSWKARDRAIADSANDQEDDDSNPTMNNKNVSNYSSDSDARYGAKGKNDIWFGYKRHLGVDMHYTKEYFQRCQNEPDIEEQLKFTFKL